MHKNEKEHTNLKLVNEITNKIKMKNQQSKEK